MNPLDPPSTIEALLRVRPAENADREPLARLIQHQTGVHKHLDWIPPLDWLGRKPFLVLQEGNRICGALACPPDPVSIAWLRLFAFDTYVTAWAAWQRLWSEAALRLHGDGAATAAAIVTQNWLEPILVKSGFELVNHIILFEMGGQPGVAVESLPGLMIRPMQPADLPRIVDVDAAAFDPLWHNSLEGLTAAYAQVVHASVAEDGSGIVGYQFATGSAFGTHLARLAVLPSSQRHGVGAALVRDLIANIPQGKGGRLTVNTQADNTASHALYTRLGFRRTGDRLPVYAFEVSSQTAGDPDDRTQL
jgi:ribosomal-protein-alanine N-acetyltransferase